MVAKNGLALISLPVIGEIFGAWSVEILVFASPTGYMFDILRFSFITLGYIFYKFL